MARRVGEACGCSVWNGWWFCFIVLDDCSSILGWMILGPSASAVYYLLWRGGCVDNSSRFEWGTRSESAFERGAADSIGRDAKGRLANLCDCGHKYTLGYRYVFPVGLVMVDRLRYGFIAKIRGETVHWLAGGSGSETNIGEVFGRGLSVYLRFAFWRTDIGRLDFLIDFDLGDAFSDPIDWRFDETIIGLLGLRDQPGLPQGRHDGVGTDRKRRLCGSLDVDVGQTNHAGRLRSGDQRREAGYYGVDPREIREMETDSELTFDNSVLLCNMCSAICDAQVPVNICIIFLRSLYACPTFGVSILEILVIIYINVFDFVPR